MVYLYGNADTLTLVNFVQFKKGLFYQYGESMHQPARKAVLHMQCVTHEKPLFSFKY